MNLVKKIGFLWAYSLPTVIVGSVLVGGPGWTWAPVGFTFVLIPILDALAGRDRSNLDKDQYETALSDRFFDVLVYSYPYIHYALLLWGSYVLVTLPMTIGQQLGLMVSIGLHAGAIINVAHELGHRSSRVAQFHAKMALLSVSYMHFLIEHNRGHHVHVATPLDPATSRRGQSVYGFWWQSVVGGYRSAWRIEEKLLAKAGQPVWGIWNEMIWFTALPILLCVVLTTAFSFLTGTVVWVVAVFFAVQSVVGFLLLETINYIEHYGIVRRELSPGKYERVNPLHSWNASDRISNFILFQLQRHSDHHAYASRPYQVLRHFDESPQLPSGYPTMIVLALLPPFWFAIMNPRLDRWKTRAYRPEEIAAVVRQFA
ncbi:alkane 1-monooxygenase [Spirosoma montaniterrae]|uniref:Alkane 1-monooxygenase n=1 Tax=Spirosoma montaniterrae TaxID=1178516 RepID=A0A1P9X163_9BACT|nr:alkane 1-monooxygenase [Spirosoma montaniterrae]AQG81364.1 alkane 1-monooxygenase [Spirosoma montaniterrae]